MHNCVARHGPYSLRQATPLRTCDASQFRGSLMPRLFRFLLSVLIAVPMPLVGCRQQRPPLTAPYDNSAMGVALTRVEYPDIEVPSRDSIFPIEPPRTLRNLTDVKYWDLSLEEAIRLALLNSNVLRDLGGAVTRSPDSVAVTTDPSVQETDPRFGVEGALSSFDATLRSTLDAQRTDRRVNNRFLGRLGFLQADNDNWDTELAKITATGTRFAVRQHIDLTRDNNPGNQFVYPDDVYNVWYEG